MQNFITQNIFEITIIIIITLVILAIIQRLKYLFYNLSNIATGFFIIGMVIAFSYLLSKYNILELAKANLFW